LPIEADAVEAMLDDFWEDEELYTKARGDPNAYTTGRIGKHNVVLAHMPGMGKVASASVASSFRSSFSDIRLGLLVGICGGMPLGANDGKEMLLGDVVISTGVVQSDFGRQYSDQAVRKDALEDNLGRPSQEVRAFLKKMEGRRGRAQLENDCRDNLDALCSKDDFTTWKYPGADEDIQYPPTYRHKHQQAGTCSVCAKCASDEDVVCEQALKLSCVQLKCDTGAQVCRSRLEKIKHSYGAAQPRSSHGPHVHFGRIASGDLVMKSGHHRDAIAAKEEVIAFEMEGAGVWDSMPTVVIKGVCDYADSHKNKNWQKYAAASAAACMKAFLQRWPITDRPQESIAALGMISSTALSKGPP